MIIPVEDRTLQDFDPLEYTSVPCLAQPNLNLQYSKYSDSQGCVTNARYLQYGDLKGSMSSASASSLFGLWIQAKESFRGSSL